MTFFTQENLGMTPPLIGHWTVQAGGDHDRDHDLRLTVNPKHSQSMLNTLLSLRVQYVQPQLNTVQDGATPFRAPLLKHHGC